LKVSDFILETCLIPSQLYSVLESLKTILSASGICGLVVVGQKEKEHRFFMEPDCFYRDSKREKRRNVKKGA